MRPKRRRVFHSAEHVPHGPASFRCLVGLCLALGIMVAIEPPARGAALLAMQVIANNFGSSGSLGTPVHRTLHQDGVTLAFDRWIMDVDLHGNLVRLSRKPILEVPRIRQLYWIAMTHGPSLPDDSAQPNPQMFKIVKQTCRILTAGETRYGFAFWHPKDHATAVLDRFEGPTPVGIGPLNSLSVDGIGVAELILYPHKATVVRRPRLMHESTLHRAVLLQYLRAKPAGMQTVRSFGRRLVAEPLPTVHLRDLRPMDPVLGRSQRWVYTAAIGSQLICVSAVDARVLWHSAGVGNGMSGIEKVTNRAWGVWLGGKDQGWLHPTQATARPTHRILLQRGDQCQYARYDSERDVVEISTPEGPIYLSPDEALARAIKTSISAHSVPEWRHE